MAEILEAPPQKNLAAPKRLVYGEDERVGLWISERTGGEWRHGGKCIGLERDGCLVAGMMVDWYNGASCYMHVAAEGRNWLNRDFLWHCFHYVFRKLECNVAIGLVSSSNKAALKFDAHLGFVEIARIPKADPAGDLVILTVTKEAAGKWLELKEAA